MKKAIALLLVLAVALGMSVVAFASTDYPNAAAAAAGDTRTAAGAAAGDTRTAAGTAAGDTRIATRSADDDTGVVYLDETNNPNVFSIRTDTSTPGVTSVTVQPNELFLVDVDNSVVVGTDEVLLPNETYKFYVYHNSSPGVTLSGSDATVISGGRLLTREHIGSTGSVKFRTVRGSSSIQSTKVRTKGSGLNQTYYIEINTRNVFGTKLTDVEYELSTTVSGTTYSNTLSTVPKSSINTFQVGFMTISDDETDVGEEGTIVIYRESPVILKDQFADIARSANYKNVIFEGEEGTWSFKGKVAGMRDTNFYYDFEPDTDLLNRFPEHEFKFLRFRAGVNFPTTGEMRIDVSDVSSDFNTMYAYLYRDGTLTEINSTFDTATDELVFRTNYLGNFIISNRRITDTSLVPELEPEEEEVPPPDYTNTNPSTGASASADAMVAVGLVSLAAAAAIGRKRK